LAACFAGCGEDPADPPSGPDAGEDALQTDVPDAEIDDAIDDVIDGLAPDPFDLADPLLPGEVAAGVIEGADALLHGPKAEGRVGDLKLYNAHVAFVVEGVRRASGYRYWGGNVVDMAAIDSDGYPRPDRYGEYFFAWNLQVFAPETLEILSDGSDGTAKVVLEGGVEPFHFLDSFIGDLLLDEAPPPLRARYVYSLGPDDRALRLEITLINEEETPAVLDLPLAMASMGDGAFAFAPGRGFDVAQMVYHPPYFSAIGAREGYGIMARDRALVPLFTYAGVSIVQEEPITIPAGSEHTLTTWFAVSDQGQSGLDAIHEDLLDLQAGATTLVGTLSLPDTVAPGSAWVGARMDGDVMTIAPVDEDGGFSLRLTPGAYAIVAHAPDHVPAPPFGVVIEPGEAPVASLEIPASARVLLSVHDGVTDAPVPSRVTLYRQGDTPSPHAPSDIRPWQKSWGGSISAVAYVTADDTEAIVPAGTYRMVATHGPTWSIHEQVVTVSADEPTSLDFTLIREVDTTGWVSADFHIHAILSPDSYVPYDIRVLQALTDFLEVPVLTEHVYVSRFQDTIDSMGVSDVVTGITGQEVTSFTHGHFNAFPLLLDPDKPNLGGVLPYDKDPIELFEAIRDQHPGDEVIQVNHPRGAVMGAYFSYVGLDAAANTVERPEHWSTNWEAIEVFNGGCGKGQTLNDWIELTNHGYAKTLSSGSDTHSESSPPGEVRNWIPIDLETLAANHGSIVPVVRARKMIVSCGPFVTFDAVDTAGEVVATLGETASLDSAGGVDLHVTVQGPTWMQIHTLNLLENGVLVATEDLSGAEGALRFDDILRVTPTSDAWYSVEIVGSGSMAPAVLGSSPYALTNPIEVDADGDGTWTAPGLQ
jgi:hypothetical protein